MSIYVKKYKQYRPLECHCGVGCLGSRETFEAWVLMDTGWWRLCGRKNLTRESSLHLPRYHTVLRPDWGLRLQMVIFYHCHTNTVGLFFPGLSPHVMSRSHFVLWPLGVADFRKWAVSLYIQAGRFIGKNTAAFSVPENGLLLIFVFCTTPWLIFYIDCALTYSSSGESNLAVLKMIRTS